MTENRFSQYLPQEPHERLAIVAGCAALLFVFGGDLWNAVYRVRENVRTQARDNLPIDLEIERARELAASLVPDLRRNHEVIVREQVDVEELRGDIQQGHENLKIQRDQLLALRATLAASGSSTNSKSSATTIRRELRHRFATFQSAEATMNAKKQTLQYREESLGKAQAAQREMFRKKQELEAQVVQFESRLKAMERNGVDSHVVFDRDKLAHCEELLHYLQKRLSIAEGLSDFSEVSLSESRSTERESQNDRIESEIDRHFDRDIK